MNDPMVLKTISLWQPWATLLVTGAKKIETRSWKPQEAGWYAIHATQTLPTDRFDLCFDRPFSKYISHPRHLPLGGIIGIVHVAGFYPTEDVRRTISEDERAFGDYTDGRWAWVTDWQYELRLPVPIRGHQSVWNFQPTSPIAAEIRAAQEASVTPPTVVNLTNDAYDVYIGRQNSSYGLQRSRWANPYKVKDCGSRQECVEAYRAYLMDELQGPQGFQWRLELAALRGKRFGCWCKPLTCHGDVIVDMIASEEYTL